MSFLSRIFKRKQRDLVKQINNATAKILEEKLPGMIEKKTGDMLEGLLNNIFTSYGEKGKKINEAISGALDINLDRLNLDDYSGIVAQIISEELSLKTQTSNLKTMIAETISMSNRGTVVTLQEIADMVIEDASFMDEHEGNISMHVEPNGSYDWTTIYLDPDEDRDTRSCAIEMVVSNRDGRIFMFRTNDASRNEGAPAMIERVRGLERELFNLYVTGATIDVESDFDTYWTQED